MKLIHVTDLHVAAPGETVWGLDPNARFAACVADINAQHADAALCVITGDLTHAGDDAAYDAFADLLAGLAMPVQLMIGNHDSRAGFRARFPDAEVDSNGFVQASRDVDAGRLLFLDSKQDGSHRGEYCARRRVWLAERLGEAGDRPVHLFLHHPPFDIGIPPLDAIGMDDAEDFWETLAPHAPRIRHLFFGHVHRPLSGSWRGIPFSTLRGTNHQCWLDLEHEGDIQGSHEPPAYAVVLLHPDRTLVHLHDYLDDSPKFPFRSPVSEGAAGG